VSIIVVATEGEDRYSNTLKRLTGLAKENTQLWRDVFAFKESFAYFIAMLHQYTKLKEVNHVFIIEDDI
jgi:hypothetical protein